ncbi:MAG TPA: TIGR00730 family Rossman fold protein [Sphingopyxis sp.]|nr:TIGR00730 family Rossman fold protein [Sphingopyxis sp.]HEX2812595.1 TIGR00730 family Rossman fold protein [Sphingopyxis sp.]
MTSRASAIERICVFSGSSAGVAPAYDRAARTLGEQLARSGIDLVYGGASVGLMGAVADAVLEAGGQVTGVIPQALVDKEVAHLGLTGLRIVNSMHERKALMANLSDGFIALPGGIGTLEEIFEVWTWAQLGSHTKPCALLNVLGFYDGMLAFLDHVAGQGFLKPVHRDMLLVEEYPAAILRAMQRYRAPIDAKWIKRAEH